MQSILGKSTKQLIVLITQAVFCVTLTQHVWNATYMIVSCTVAEHHHNVYPFLCMVWLQHPLRLGMLFSVLSCLGSILQGLACCSISYNTLAVTVSAKAWHALWYLITPWQYLPLGHCLACFSIPYHALVLSAEACFNILYGHVD